MYERRSITLYPSIGNRIDIVYLWEILWLYEPLLILQFFKLDTEWCTSTISKSIITWELGISMYVGHVNGAWRYGAKAPQLYIIIYSCWHTCLVYQEVRVTPWLYRYCWFITEFEQRGLVWDNISHTYFSDSQRWFLTHNTTVPTVITLEVFWFSMQ